MPTRAPKWLVSAPMRGAPRGVPPMKASMYSPITRPRSRESTATCTDALAMDWNARLVKPMAASRARNTAWSGARAAVVCRRPKAAADATIVRGPGRAAAPANSAPVADPMARAMLNRPYVLALPPNVDLAMAVSTIGKFSPNVPNIPTRKMVRSTSGRSARYRAVARSAPGSRGTAGAGVRSEGRSRSRPMAGPA